MGSTIRRLVLSVAFAWLANSPALAGDGNRLTYLDSADPYYVGRHFPKLTTPQWVGEEGVKAVVILAIDDMRHDQPGRPLEKYDATLRPSLDRLKRIDGRAPASIMSNRVDPADPRLVAWVEEGVTIEVHTYDHPCPFLADGDFAKAKGTYERCVDLMASVPGNRAIAFRMPCCDSINSPSPRFFSGIFDRVTPAGNFLQVDTSVFNVTTSADADLRRELTLEPDGRERFGKYLPFPSFVNTIDDYPYPYLINRVCWEFPCATPSDWQAQRLHRANNPRTLADWKALLDATVIKQGTMTLVFHPHDWVKPGQVAELVDYADGKYGKAVKFLNFREVLERLNANLLGEEGVRAEKSGADNGVRLLDLNADGFQDVVIGNERVKKTRVWQPGKNQWIVGDFPLILTGRDVRFGMLNGSPVAIAAATACRFADGKWSEDKSLLAGLTEIVTRDPSRDAGVRLRDLDLDGTCELIVSNPRQQAVYRFDLSGNSGWSKLPFALPAGTSIVDAEGRDAGLRFVDLDEDGYDDVVFSNDAGYAIHLFTSTEAGWGKTIMSGRRGERKPEEELPRVVRGNGENNGAWFHSRHMWVQNEDTSGMPNHVDRRAFAELLKDVQPAPRDPADAPRSMGPLPGFTVDLVAAELLVADPIYLDFGPDGRLNLASAFRIPE